VTKSIRVKEAIKRRELILNFCILIKLISFLRYFKFKGFKNLSPSQILKEVIISRMKLKHLLWMNQDHHINKKNGKDVKVRSLKTVVSF